MGTVRHPDHSLRGASATWAGKPEEDVRAGFLKPALTEGLGIDITEANGDTRVAREPLAIAPV